MTESNESKYAMCRKKVWRLYAVLVVVLIVILVAFVAQDDEERLFFTLMTLAASYVLRPGDRQINKAVLRLFNVSPPEDTDTKK